MTSYIEPSVFIVGQRVCVRAIGKPAFVGRVAQTYGDGTYDVDSWRSGPYRVGVQVPWTAMAEMSE